MGFDHSHVNARLDNPHNTPAITSDYFNIWPIIPVHEVDELQKIFLGIPRVEWVKKEKRKDFTLDDEFLHFGKATILDTIGTSIIVLTDETVKEELRYTRSPWEERIGPAGIVTLERLVIVTVFPSEAVCRMKHGDGGKWNDRVSKSLLVSS